MKSEVNMHKPLREIFMDWLAMRWTILRAGFLVPLEKGIEADLFTDSDQKRWIDRGLAAGYAAEGKYGPIQRGHLTRSGQGSLEVGAAQEWRVGG
jgi:hypothetical protein